MKITWGIALKVWWTFWWRYTLAMAAFLILLHLSAVNLLPPPLSRAEAILVQGIVFFIQLCVYAGIGAYFIGQALDRDYGSFSVGLRSTRSFEQIKMSKKKAFSLWVFRTCLVVGLLLVCGMLLAMLKFLFGVSLPQRALGPVAAIIVDIYCFKILLESRHDIWKVVVLPIEQPEEATLEASP